MSNKPPRVEVVTEPGMHATCVFGPQDGIRPDNNVALLLGISSLNRLAEFRAFMRRGLNTNDQAPKWLFDLCDAIEESPMPKRMERPEPEALHGIMASPTVLDSL